MKHLLLCSLALAGMPQLALADDSPADAKYKAGFAHFKQQDFVHACSEFEDSERLEANPATEYFLAKCAVQQGHLARAWNLFKRAATGIADPKQRSAAEQGATDLVPEVGLVTLVGTQPAPGLEVRLDDDIVTSQVLVGLAIAVDPGAHKLRAIAPRRDAWSRDFTIAKGESLNFTVPSLPSMPPQELSPKVTPPATPPAETPHAAPPIAPPPPPPLERHDATTPPSSHRARHVAEVSSLAVGLTGVVVGGVTGLLASSKWSDAKRGCTEMSGQFVDCPAGNAQLRDDAKTMASLSTAGFVVGGIGLAAAAILYFTTPAEQPAPRTTRLVPTTSGHDVGLTLTGRF